MTRFLTAPIMYALAGLLALSLVFNGAQAFGKAKLETQLAQSQTALAEQTASIATEREAFERQARAAEQKHTAEMARIDREQQEQTARDQASNDRLVADLRSGNVRLHQRWQAALATSRLSAGVATASGADEAASDVEDSLGRVFRGARASDAQVIGLQQVVRSMQATCSGSPKK